MTIPTEELAEAIKHAQHSMAEGEEWPTIRSAYMDDLINAAQAYLEIAPALEKLQNAIARAKVGQYANYPIPEDIAVICEVSDKIAAILQGEKK